MQFLHVYYAVTIVALYGLPLYLKRRPGHDSRVVMAFLTAGMALVYMVGMLRTEGIDLDVYRESFEDPHEDSIPDWGFRMLIHAMRWLQLPFPALMFLIGLFSIAAVLRLARSFQLNGALLLLIWFMHVAVVRDFSQTRIGFAMSIALFAVTSRSQPVRWTWYGLSASMHLTALVFILAYEVCLRVARIPSTKWRNTWIAAMMTSIFSTGQALGLLGFIDDRIDIYLNWEREGYGVPVDSYGSLALHFGIIALAWVCRRHWEQDPRLKAIFYLELLGVTSFVAFADVAIFAFRLSNVLVSLYAVLLGHCLVAMYSSPGRWSVVRAGALAQAYLMAIFLLFRPGSYEILAAMAFS